MSLKISQNGDKRLLQFPTMHRDKWKLLFCSHISTDALTPLACIANGVCDSKELKSILKKHYDGIHRFVNMYIYYLAELAFTRLTTLAPELQTENGLPPLRATEYWIKLLQFDVDVLAFCQVLSAYFQRHWWHNVILAHIRRLYSTLSKLLCTCSDR